MSLSGNYNDLHLETFKGILLKETQQEGSVLGGIFPEMAVSGKTTTFHKMGKHASKLKAQKGEIRSVGEATFEERNLTSRFIYADEQLDVEELGNIVQNPKSQIIQSMMMELGRQKDEIIEEKLTGTQVVIADGSSTNQALTLSVAVNSHEFDSGSGDVGLTVSKVISSEKKIKELFGAMPNASLLVIGKFSQLANLAASDDAKNRDKHIGMPLSSPGIYNGLQGLLGHTYIAYEGLGVDVNGDDKVIVCTKDALFVGIKRAFQVQIAKNPNAVGMPEIIEAAMEMCVARTDENKVCVIACNPV